MNINSTQLNLVKRIDSHVNSFPDTDTGNGQLLTTLFDYMESFKQIMDTTTQTQMNYLTSEYKGFCRFSKLLELMAKGISDGSIQVPKDH